MSLHQGVAITFDPTKREAALRERDVDFRSAELVFAGPTYEAIDDRKDYGETRVVTAGLLDGRMMIVVWTSRGDDRHVISMRKANVREQARYTALIRPPVR